MRAIAASLQVSCCNVSSSPMRVAILAVALVAPTGEFCKVGKKWNIFCWQKMRKSALPMGIDKAIANKGGVVPVLLAAVQVTIVHLSKGR